MEDGVTIIEMVDTLGKVIYQAKAMPNAVDHDKQQLDEALKKLFEVRQILEKINHKIILEVDI